MTKLIAIILILCASTAFSQYDDFFGRAKATSLTADSTVKADSIYARAYGGIVADVWSRAGTALSPTTPTDTVVAKFFRVSDSAKVNVLSWSGGSYLIETSPGEMLLADALSVGSTSTARVRFSSSSSIAFVGASGSNADIAVWALPKGVGDFNITYNGGADFGLSVSGTTGAVTTKKLKINTVGALLDSATVISDSLFFWIGGTPYGFKQRQ